jgi:hypothetical protein
MAEYLFQEERRKQRERGKPEPKKPEWAPPPPSDKFIMVLMGTLVAIVVAFMSVSVLLLIFKSFLRLITP